MDDKNGDSLAFPMVIEQASRWHEGGLTKREYFAGLAMQWFERPFGGATIDPSQFIVDIRKVATMRAKLAVIQADALLAELANNEVEP